MLDFQNVLVPLLASLVGYLGKVWVDERNRKKENFNQLSSNAYQKLFDKKIDTYNKLASISFKFTKFDIAYSKAIEQADIEEETKKILIQKHYEKIYGTYLEFEKIIQQDFIILSPEVSNSYIEWQKFLYHQSKNLLQDVHQIHASGIDTAFKDLETQSELADFETYFSDEVKKVNTHSSELKALIIGELIEANSDKFNDIIGLIKNDILKINRRINDFKL